jgi:nitroreductase / dihydropteridine reductase
MNIDIMQHLRTRYSSKAFIKNSKLDQTTVDKILESANLAPTSYGIQPFKIIEISTIELKEKISKLAWNQPQITTCDRLFIWAVDSKIDTTLEEYEKRVTKSGRLDEDKSAKFVKLIEANIPKITLQHETLINWHAKQAYISLGFALSTCALLDVASCALEGFDHKEVDKLLGLSEMNLESVVFLAIGIEDPNDQNKTNPKVRKSVDELIIRL